MSREGRFKTVINPPRPLFTQRFMLRALTTADTQRDFDAVNTSRADLRRWSQDGWPREGFTIEENRRDLERHEREHRLREAFTYTVLDADRDTCLGCVYVRPLQTAAAGASDPPLSVAEAADDAARVLWWVRSDRLNESTPEDLLEALEGWFAEAWPLPRVLFQTADALEWQTALYRRRRWRREFSVEYPRPHGPARFGFWRAA